MGSVGVVVVDPAGDDDAGLGERVELLRSRSSRRAQALDDSMKPFCQGEPGSMVRVLMPRRARPSRTTLAMNSEPLSERAEHGVSPYPKRSAPRFGLFGRFLLRSLTVRLTPLADRKK